MNQESAARNFTVSISSFRCLDGAGVRVHNLCAYTDVSPYKHRDVCTQSSSLQLALPDTCMPVCARMHTYVLHTEYHMLSLKP